jgi:MGT family glycosyltransferase
MARIVLACWGSHGDLFPYLGLAVALKARGHRPVIATNAGYRAEVEREGVELVEAGPTIDANAANALELYERAMDPIKGGEFIVRELLLPQLAATYEQLRAAAKQADLLVTHPITYAAPILAERERLPWLSTTLAPMLFFSRYDPPVLPALPRLGSLPLIGRWLERHAALPLARRATRAWMEPVHRLRAQLGLPRGRNPLFEGQFSPYGTLALFSRALAEPQPDWPPSVTITGTAFYNAPDPLDPALEEFLAGGRPPVVFTLGTSAVGAAGRFYQESAAAAATLGVRAVLLTGGLARNRPERVPPDVMLADRVPHQSLFPRASAVVHQCGAGTTAQALRSGIPALLVPHGHDQFDNARRVARLGVGRSLLPREYRAARVARELAALLGNPAYRDRAASVAELVRAERGAEAAADVIERTASDGRSAAGA